MDDADPVIHFYEDFLKEYDPDLRKKMGAYYTPLPVVRFIIRSVDYILQKEFNLPNGLADTSKLPNNKHRVQILDPAVGTGTFISAIITAIYERLKKQGQPGRWPAYVHNDLLPRLNGFELMMTPYTIAHLKVSIALRETGFKYFNETKTGKTRLRVYLTNSLEQSEAQQDLFSFGFAESIAAEAKEADKIKNETPIMVVIGNPPYSGESSNKFYSGHDVYKVEPTGEKLKERNSKFLNDDYVKFIRFAENMIEKTGEGIVAMITAHGYLDNPTFRGMRWHLSKTFDTIWILDLHGNAKKKEVAPDGSKDENVFNIQQGVAIIVAVKTGKKKANEFACVHHTDIFGNRRNKFSILNNSGELQWQKITLDKQMFFFVRKNIEGKEEYGKGFRLNDFFSQFSTGILTKNDDVAIAFHKNEIWSNVQKFFIEPEESLRLLFNLKRDSRDWVLKKAIDDIQRNYSEDNIVTVSYRPFDSRYTYYTGTSRGFMAYSQMRVMHNLFNKKNLALVSGRQGQVVGGMEWNLLFATKDISDLNIFYRGGGTVFPLYVYDRDGSRTPNFNMEIVNKIENIVGKITPEDIFDYIYAVLHSPSYREKYKEFLKIDFPRIPYPKDTKTFKILVVIGAELRSLHLLESPKVNQFITTYPIAGSNTVEKLTFKDGKVFINVEQYFGNVPEVAWNFYIGGYQPAQKWLKDRKGRALTNTDIEHYQKIIVALAETNRIIKEIDSNILL